MKKILCFCIVTVMLFATASVSSAAVMYSLDGRTLSVDDSQVDAYKAVGWYNGPIITMYALDGRTAYVGERDVDAWKAVGWYNGPITTMYALDGRTAYVGERDVDAWKAVGWYNGPLTTMYALDGRTACVGERDVDAWKAVGWYTEPKNPVANDNQYSSSTYPGTTAPTYTSVTGVKLISETNYGDYSAYLYKYTNSKDLDLYRDTLLSLGWERTPVMDYSSKSISFFSVLYVKDGKHLDVSVYWGKYQPTEIRITC